MAAIQRRFTLRISSDYKTVHLLGSWDNYSGQLPLLKDPKKNDEWLGCFQFHGFTLKPGQRYWYYYIIDRHRVSYDPAKDFITEPTTGRKLNILDIPTNTKASSSTSSDSSAQSHRAKSASVPQGRGISPSRIVAPRPKRPLQTRKVINTQYNEAALEVLATCFAHQTLDGPSGDGSE